MANQKITELAELAELPNGLDEFVLVDKSDTTMDAGGTNKRFKFNNIYSVTSETSSATPTITGTALKNDYVATALALNTTLAAPSGTANPNAVLRYRITSTGTYTVGYDAALLTGNITRTTSLANGETLTQIYQRVGSTWVCVFDDVTA